MNYGAIGQSSGTKISHAFDDQGSKTDGVGNLRDWWSPQDRQRFVERTSGLVAQYAAYEPLPGTRVDGELTLGENIADLAGLGIAYEAYRVSLAGVPAPDIDGFTATSGSFWLGAGLAEQDPRRGAARATAQRPAQPRRVPRQRRRDQPPGLPRSLRHNRVTDCSNRTEQQIVLW